MKRTIMIVGLMAALFSTAFGEGKFVRVKVPFEFMMSGQACPAGIYEFSITDQLVTAQNVETGEAVVLSFLTRLAEDNSANGTARISFDLSEGKRFVEAIWLGQGDGYLVHMVHTHEIVSAVARIDEGAQLGSAYPEITHWPDLRVEARIDEGAQLGSAYPEITHWPDLRVEAKVGGQN